VQLLQVEQQQGQVVLAVVGQGHEAVGVQLQELEGQLLLLHSRKAHVKQVLLLQRLEEWVLCLAESSLRGI
jgi:hypothetical protein